MHLNIQLKMNFQLINTLKSLFFFFSISLYLCLLRLYSLLYGKIILIFKILYFCFLRIDWLNKLYILFHLYTINKKNIILFYIYFNYTLYFNLFFIYSFFIYFFRKEKNKKIETKKKKRINNKKYFSYTKKNFFFIIENKL